MKNFFKENKIFLTILIGALVIWGVIYFFGSRGKVGEKEANEEISNVKQNCPNIPELPDGALKLVIKIIDGDTFLIKGGYSVRILGIDTDEKGYPCYEAARDKLEELILNKEVKLEQGEENLDKYCRYLRHIVLNNQNIGLELVKQGLAVTYFFSENVKYRDEIIQAEKIAKENKIGCKWFPVVKVEEKRNETIEFQWEKLIPELIGLKIVDVCQASNYYNREIIVEGKVASTYRSKTNTVFLNFGKVYPNQCFTGVIFSSDQYKFVESSEKYYENKIVRIKGVIREYQGRPEIILKDPSQIEIGK